MIVYGGNTYIKLRLLKSYLKTLGYSAQE